MISEIKHTVTLGDLPVGEGNELCLLLAELVELVIELFGLGIAFFNAVLIFCEFIFDLALDTNEFLDVFFKPDLILGQ